MEFTIDVCNASTMMSVKIVSTKISTRKQTIKHSITNLSQFRVGRSGSRSIFDL